MNPAFVSHSGRAYSLALALPLALTLFSPPKAHAQLKPTPSTTSQKHSAFIIGFGLNTSIVGPITTSSFLQPSAASRPGFWTCMGLTHDASPRTALRWAAVLSITDWDVAHAPTTGFRDSFSQMGILSSAEWRFSESLDQPYVLASLGVMYTRSKGLGLSTIQLNGEVGVGIKFESPKSEHRFECVYRAPTSVSHPVNEPVTFELTTYSYQVHVVALRYLVR